MEDTGIPAAHLQFQDGSAPGCSRARPCSADADVPVGRDPGERTGRNKTGECSEASLGGEAGLTSKGCLRHRKEGWEL